VSDLIPGAALHNEVEVSPPDLVGGLGQTADGTKNPFPGEEDETKSRHGSGE
jgi:hypothetical protein